MGRKIEREANATVLGSGGGLRKGDEYVPANETLRDGLRAAYEDDCSAEGLAKMQTAKKYLEDTSPSELKGELDEELKRGILTCKTAFKKQSN